MYQAISIGNLNGLDYGSAMAYSFFHGYLQIVLPHKGTDQKGIQEIIRDFEAQQGVVFSSHKLFVLIPLSLHCPATIEQTSSIVELAQVYRNLLVLVLCILIIKQRFCFMSNIFRICQK